MTNINRLYTFLNNKEAWDKAKDIDEHAVRELYIYVTNDGDLYRQRYLPMIQNLSKKKAKGTYDPELAVKMFMYMVDDGAKKYLKEHAETGARIQDVFNKATRTEVAKELRDKFESEYELQEYDFMKQSNTVIAEDDEDEFEEEEFQEEEMVDEPQPDDYVMYNSGTLGSRTSVGIVEGGFLGEYDSEEAAAVAIQKDMKKINFYPSVWFQDDHGGVTPVNLNDYLTASKKTSLNDRDGIVEGDTVTVVPNEKVKKELIGQTGTVVSWNQGGYLVKIGEYEYVFLPNEIKKVENASEDEKIAASEEGVELKVLINNDGSIVEKPGLAIEGEGIFDNEGNPYPGGIGQDNRVYTTVGDDNNGIVRLDTEEDELVKGWTIGMTSEEVEQRLNELSEKTAAPEDDAPAEDANEEEPILNEDDRAEYERLIALPYTWDEDGVKSELLRQFGIEAFDDINDTLDLSGARYSDWGEAGGVTIDGDEYNIIKDTDEADNIALAVVKQDIENEPEIFNQDFLQHHVFITDTDKRMIIADEEESVREQVESEADVDQFRDEALDALGGEEAFTDEDDIVDTDAMEDAITEKADELAQEWIDKEVDSRLEDIESRLDDPISYFVNEQGIYTLDELMKANFINIDYDEAAQEAVNADGFAHFISHYDGNYDETNNGLVFFRE